MSIANRNLGDVLGGCIDPLKGLLILVVVLDHNDVAHALFPETFRPLTFHVLGFLLLPFVIKRPPLSRRFVLDRLARYWVPFLAIVTVSSLTFWLFYKGSARPVRALLEYALAVAIGSAPLVKEATGFLAYWFLPAFLGLTVVLGVYQGASAAWRRVMAALFVAAHCLLTRQTFGAYYWVPFGLAIVANVFVLGLILRAVVGSAMAYRARYVFPITFVVSYGWLVQQHTWLEIMVLQTAPITSLATFLAQDVAAISGVVTAVLIANRLHTSRVLAAIGHHSLMIYLFHPLFYVPVTMVLLAAGVQSAPTGVALLLGVASFTAVVLASWAAAALLARSKAMCAWIAPRHWNEWAVVAAARSMVAYRV
jgi:hypothetical protein